MSVDHVALLVEERLHAQFGNARATPEQREEFRRAVARAIDEALRHGAVGATSHALNLGEALLRIAKLEATFRIERTLLDDQRRCCAGHLEMLRVAEEKLAKAERRRR